MTIHLAENVFIQFSFLFCLSHEKIGCSIKLQRSKHNSRGNPCYIWSHWEEIFWELILLGFASLHVWRSKIFSFFERENQINREFANSIWYDAWIEKTQNESNIITGVWLLFFKFCAFEYSCMHLHIDCGLIFLK